jgi:phenylacetate-CoA ligase
VSGLYTPVVGQLLFPLHERAKGHDSVRRRRELERTQWLPASQIAELQANKLRAFLIDVQQHVPYYRELFDAHRFDPRAVRSAADLSRLPLLTKATLRARGEDFKARDHGPLTRYNTGGSSGEPLVFHIGKARKSHDVAAKWRATRWWNVDIGDKELVVWGSPIEIGAQDRVRRLRDGLMRSWLLPAFDMSPASLTRYVERIVHTRPAMLFGYPSSLALIARHAAARGVDLRRAGVRVVFVTAERLYDEQRAAIAQAFGCPVANGYGARDAGFIAHECPHGTMHLSAEDIVVETVDAAGQPVPPGTAGEIVVTHLATRDFPFIRYRTGDVGTLGEAGCACGRGLPSLREIHGRTTDFVVAADGTVMHGLALIYVLRDLAGVDAFKIVQHSTQRTEVLLKGDARLLATHHALIAREFRARLGADVDVCIRHVDEIAPQANGKHRYVVSQVALPGAAGGVA